MCVICSHWKLFLFVLLCCWLTTGATSRLHAQMTATVNSLADDLNAIPWDDPNTTEDESQDGVCRDLAGRCTLRAALLEAGNMNDGNGVPCDLTINLSGVINLSSPPGDLYPTDGSNLHGNQQTTISGLAQLTLGHNTTVRGLKFIDGLLAIDVTGDGNTISGNVFSNKFIGIIVGGVGNIIGGSSPAERNIFMRCRQVGITLGGANNVVIGNYIGINAQGDTAGNQVGISVGDDNNTIGSTNPDMRNIISGNTVAGISIETTPGVGLGATVIGNFIGTDPSGTQSRPNAIGIEMVSGHAVIGGALPAERNVISGNSFAGIVTRGNTLAPTIIGNYIGLDASGTLPLSNRDGIDMSPGSFDCVVEGNRISNNLQYGIYILGTASDPSWNHRIRGNQITRNSIAGIAIFGKANDIVVGSSLSQDFVPNEIQFNEALGVVLHEYLGQYPRANTIRKNDFRNNVDVGIDIYPNASQVQDGILPPTIQNYTDLGNGHATVTASHDRVGALVDVYLGETNDSLRYEGQHWLGSGSVAQSNVPFTFTIDACNCTHLVATATDLAENTSEFSPALSVVTGVREDHEPLPTRFSLENAYPNPFNPSTRIGFQLPAVSFVRLKVYDVLGREVRTLVSEELKAGRHETTFEATGLTSGLYFYRLDAPSFSASKKLLIVK